MEIKSMGGDGMYTFAIVADANVRRRYRVRRRTGAIQVFANPRDQVGSHWRSPPPLTAAQVKRAMASMGQC